MFMYLVITLTNGVQIESSQRYISKKSTKLWGLAIKPSSLEQIVSNEQNIELQSTL